MPRRGENIRKRKDGRWEGRYLSGTDDRGRSKYRSVYGKTYREVKAKVRLRTSDPTPPAKPQEHSVKEILKYWMQTNCITLKNSTRYKYDYMIEKHILPELGALRVSQLDTKTINTFMENKLSKGRLNHQGGLSGAYVRSMMLIINAALRFAETDGFCTAMAARIPKPAADRKSIAILNHKDQARLEAMLYRETDLTKLGILLSLKIGLRIGEVCALTWDDVDFESRVLHIRATIARVKNTDPMGKQKTVLILDRPKTQTSARDIPLPSSLLSVLSPFAQNRLSRFVISDTDGFVNPRTYAYRYITLLKKHGIKPIHYHALRHTFATRCIEAGVDIKSLSEILGHTNVTITLNTYVHSSMELKRMQLEKTMLVDLQTEQGLSSW